MYVHMYLMLPNHNDSSSCHFLKYMYLVISPFVHVRTTCLGLDPTIGNFLRDNATVRAFLVDGGYMTADVVDTLLSATLDVPKVQQPSASTSYVLCRDVMKYNSG